jgi:membrane protein
VLTLLLNVFGTTLLGALPLQDLELLSFLWELLDRRFIVMLLLQTGLFSAMYMALPNRHNTFRDSVPGAVLASLGWLVFSDLYSVYVRYFTAYANIYGSVYAVALSMLWLYCCLSIVFYGGALNHFLATHRHFFTKEGV